MGPVPGPLNQFAAGGAGPGLGEAGPGGCGGVVTGEPAGVQSDCADELLLLELLSSEFSLLSSEFALLSSEFSLLLSELSACFV